MKLSFSLLRAGSLFLALSFGSVAQVTRAQAAPTSTPTAVVAWGANFPFYGQLGDGTGQNRPLPVDITNNGALNGKTVVQIAVGDNHTVALCSDGTLATWGHNATYGQLGDGSDSYSEFLPIDITGKGALNGKRVIQIASGQSHVVVLCSDGTVAAWGRNTEGELGDGSKTNRRLPVNITPRGALLRKKVTQLVAGGLYTLALCSDGTVATWGFNQVGQLGDGTTTTRYSPVDITNKGALNGKAVVRLVAGFMHTLALCSDGSLVGWGTNDQGQLADSNRTIRTSPQLVVPTGALKNKNIIQLVAGDAHTLALCNDRSVVVWGSNNLGELGTGVVSADIQSQPLDITTKGALNARTVTAIASGYHHCLALCTDGAIVTWGSNTYGQIGNGSSGSGVYQPLPVAITGKGALTGKRVIQLMPSTYHSFVLVGTPENQAPQIRILTPTANQIISLSQFNGTKISGNASDNVEVARVQLKLYRTRRGVLEVWDGTSFSSTTSRTVAATLVGSGSNLTWNMSAKAPSVSQLDAGLYSLIAYVTDTSGNNSSARVSFTLSANISGDNDSSVSTNSAGGS